MSLARVILGLRAATATVTYLVLAAISVFGSGAPLRVHAVSLACLVFAVPLPIAILSGAPMSPWRWVLALVLIFFSMAMWDGVSWTVLGKEEPFDILRWAPGAYGIALLAIGDDLVRHGHGYRAGCTNRHAIAATRSSGASAVAAASASTLPVATSISSAVRASSAEA